MMGFAPCGRGDLGTSRVTVDIAMQSEREVRQRAEHVCRRAFGRTSLAIRLVTCTCFWTSVGLCVFSQLRTYSATPLTLGCAALARQYLLCCDLMANRPELAHGAVSPSESEALLSCY